MAVGSQPDFQADVRSIERLSDLHQALLSFVSRAPDGLAQIESQVLRRCAGLAAAESAAEREVQRCREALEAADEDEDAGDLEAELNEATAKCDEIGAANRRVAQCRQAFIASTERVARVLEREGRGGIHFLAARLSALRDAAGVRPEWGAPSGGKASGGTPQMIPAPATKGGSGLTSFALPRGFTWVQLDEIDLTRGLEGVRGPADFKKVSYDDVVKSLDRLKAEVLPNIQNLASSPKDHFREIDAKNGDSYSTGIQRVYEAFFGDHDYVYLERGPRDARFSITNGRHRIKAARDLGWDAIPAQIKDLRS